VRRRVTILGDPSLLPELDASMSIRAFRVLDGGFLELKFVRVRMGMGTMRKRGDPPRPEEEEAMHMHRHAQVRGHEVGGEGGGWCAMVWEGCAAERCACVDR
jgi:hypothetical protein